MLRHVVESRWPLNGERNEFACPPQQFGSLPSPICQFLVDTVLLPPEESLGPIFFAFDALFDEWDPLFEDDEIQNWFEMQKGKIISYEYSYPQQTKRSNDKNSKHAIPSRLVDAFVDEALKRDREGQLDLMYEIISLVEEWERYTFDLYKLVGHLISSHSFTNFQDIDLSDVSAYEKLWNVHIEFIKGNKSIN